MQKLLFVLQYIILLRVLKGVGLHMHDARRQWDALVRRLSPVQIRTASVQRDGQAFLLQLAHKYVVCQLESVLH